MGWVWLFIAVVVGAGIALGIFQGSVADKIRKRLSAELGEGADVFVSTDDFTFIGIPRSADFVLVGSGSKQFKYEIPAIASVEILRDDVVVNATNRGSQAVGAVVGGLAFGGVGAVVGALTGSSRSAGKLRRVSLRLIVDDRQSPVHEVTFFKSTNSKKGSDPRGLLAKPGIDAAERYNALLVGPMRQAEQARIARPVSSLGLPDQLRQLWDLKEKGALTAIEFEQEKAKLLGRDPGGVIEERP